MKEKKNEIEKDIINFLKSPNNKLKNKIETNANIDPIVFTEIEYFYNALISVHLSKGKTPPMLPCFDIYPDMIFKNCMIKTNPKNNEDNFEFVFEKNDPSTEEKLHLYIGRNLEIFEFVKEHTAEKFKKVDIYKDIHCNLNHNEKLTLLSTSAMQGEPSPEEAAIVHTMYFFENWAHHSNHGNPSINQTGTLLAVLKKYTQTILNIGSSLDTHEKKDFNNIFEKQVILDIKNISEDNRYNTLRTTNYLVRNPQQFNSFLFNAAGWSGSIMDAQKEENVMKFLKDRKYSFSPAVFYVLSKYKDIVFKDKKDRFYNALNNMYEQTNLFAEQFFLSKKNLNPKTNKIKNL